jgi:DNA-binding XRE family transcriptional regulator
MNNPRHGTDFADRRRRLGASRETMAAGLGLPFDTVKAIEDGAASGPQYDAYGTWLQRIEAWPADVRARQLQAAGKGRLFDSNDQE